jgi:hypothetical protein
MRRVTVTLAVWSSSTQKVTSNMSPSAMEPAMEAKELREPCSTVAASFFVPP